MSYAIRNVNGQIEVKGSKALAIQALHAKRENILNGRMTEVELSMLQDIIGIKSDMEAMPATLQSIIDLIEDDMAVAA